MGSRMLARFSAILLLQTCLTVETVESAQQIEVAGVKVKQVGYQGPATISAEVAQKHRLKIAVDPRTEREALTIGVELPVSGRDAWPAADVEVLDAKRQAVSALHTGIDWHKLQFVVPAVPAEYTVHVVEPPGDRPRPLPGKGRRVTDETTGLGATIDKWFQGRRAALSIRFDDSHPTHLSKVVPILGEYGFRGTFMVNPGDHPPNSRRRSAFQTHRSEWEAVARSGDHEFANHSLHHRGATGDADMEQQVGDASKAIWALFPDNSRLLALNLGGGTKWETTRTLRYYLDKYHLFDASSGSMGMDDVYGNRVAAFRQHLERHIQSEGWCKMHFHAIGENRNSSEANFRGALDIAKEHESQVWIAGMAEIHKYRTERERAELSIANKGPNRAVLTLRCSTEPDLYDQALTIRVALPPAWAPDEVSVKSVASAVVVPTVSPSEDAAIRFDVPPIAATYIIERVP